MKGVSDYVVAYDVSDNMERRKIEKTLREFGFRIQRSVFECRMNKGAKVLLIKRLEELHAKSGFIKLYRLDFSSKNEIVGVATNPNPDSGSAFIV